jgi:hypothetical protein
MNRSPLLRYLFVSWLAALALAQPAAAQTINVTTPLTTVCAGNTVPISFVTTGTFNTGNRFFIQLSDATGVFPALPAGELGNVFSTTGSTAFAAFPTGLPPGTGYRVRVVSDNPFFIGDPSAPFEIVSVLPNPNLFGNGVWNAYVFRDLNFSNYAGSFVDPPLNFDRAFGDFVSPSTAPGFTGCLPEVDFNSYSISYRRTNFACGFYQFDLVHNDDECEIFVNGNLVFSRNTSSTFQANVWRGFLGPTTQVEFRWRQRLGPSRGALNIVPATFALTSPTNFQICPGGSTPISLTAAQPLNYVWSPGVGLNTTTGPNVVANPTATTTYTVTATDPASGCLAGTANITVEVGGPPAPLTVTPSNPSICPGNSEQLIANGGANYTWSPATGLNTTSGPIVIASPPATTTYTLTANDGCTTRNTTVTVNVGPPPAPSPAFGINQWNVFAYNDLSWGNFAGYYVSPQQVVGGVDLFDSRDYWGGLASPSDAPGYIGCPVPIEGHSVRYLRRGFVPCNTVYQLDITDAQNNVQVILNGNTIFANAGGGSFPSVWRGILGFNSELDIRWSNPFNQSFMAAALRPVSAVPAPRVIICPGESYLLSAVDVPGATYEWRLGVGGPPIANSREFTVNPPANQIYEVFIFDPVSACSVTATVEVIVDANPQPVPISPALAADLQICPGQSVTLTAGGTGNDADYTWTPIAGIIGSNVGRSIVVRPSATTTYTVTQNITGAGCLGTSRTGAATVTVGSGDPDTWGINQWHAQAFYQGQYAGFFPNANLSIRSRTSWDANGSPSDAPLYTGCPVPDDYHRVRYRREGFPCGYYRLSIPSHALRNQFVRLAINGVEVARFEFPYDNSSAINAFPPHNNLWEGFLGPASRVEFEWLAEVFESFGDLDLVNVGDQINFVANEITICNAPAGTPNILRAGWPNFSPGTSFTWSVNNPALLTLTPNNPLGTEVTATPLGNGDVVITVTATDPAGSACPLTRNVPARITATPVYALDQGDATICRGERVRVRATGGSTYTWTSVPPGQPVRLLTGVGDEVELRPTVTTTYTATAVNGCGSTPLSITLTVQQPVDPPTEWGVGQWVVRSYNGVEPVITNNVYRGYFTIPDPAGSPFSNLTFRTDTYYPMNGTPSQAPGYQGCDTNNDNHTLVFRRTGFECGVYTIGLEDVWFEWELVIDGVPIANNGGGTFPNVWSGVLTASSQVQFRYRSRVGNSSFSFVVGGSPILGLGGVRTIWTGGQDNNWYNANNWCLEVPTSTIDAVIGPTVSGRMPVIDNNSTLNPFNLPTATENILFEDNTSLTIVAGNTLSVHGDWINNGATFLPHPTSAVVLTGGTSTNLGGTEPTTFANLRLEKTNPNLTVTLGNNIGVNQTLTLNNTGLDLNANRVTINNPDPTALARLGTGYIRSETNAANNPSYLCWNMGTNTGVYEFPFGLSALPNEYIPVTLNKRSSSRGDFCISTRRTGVNNQPFADIIRRWDVPAEVVVDRWWHVLINGTLGINDLTPPGYDLTLRYTASENTLPANINTQPLKAQKADLFSYWANPPDQDFAPGVLTGVGANTVRSLRDGGALVLLTEDVFILPVELISFTGRYLGDHVLLEWQTAWEVNNRHFVVERSANGRDFVAIGQVEGRGNGLRQVTRYQLADREPLPGLAYYRLRQVDFGGTVSYSRIVAVETPQASEPYLEARPNPTQTEAINLFLQAPPNLRVKLLLTDVTGRPLAEAWTQTNARGQVLVRLQPPVALATGVYICQAEFAGQKLQTKVLVK